MEQSGVDSLAEQQTEINVKNEVDSGLNNSSATTPLPTGLSSVAHPSSGLPGLSFPSSASLCNFVKKLQEACVLKKLNFPSYKTIAAFGQPHCKTFTVKCSLADLNSLGWAPTKKGAKQEAARKMIGILNERSPSVPTGRTVHYFTAFLGSYQNGPDVDDPKFLKITPTGPTLKSLTLEVIKNTHQAILRSTFHDVCKEEGFGLSYREVPFSGQGNKHWMAVLNTPDLSVYHGSGDSDVKAVENAAVNALTFLKLMSS